MYSEKVFAVIITIVCLSYESVAINSYSCGIDNSKTNILHEGEADIEMYPWLGVLFYPLGPINHVYDICDSISHLVNEHFDEIEKGENELEMTTIVLISNQMALAAALDIDRYPKKDFRSLSRVVLGTNCSGPYINVLNYNYHPDFTTTTYSTVAMIQLDTLSVWRRLHLRSICPPPNLLKNAEVYAMTLTDDCTSRMVRIYKMEYVDPKECKEYYRRANLDLSSMWPTHVACARATRGGSCVWRSGTVLVMRDHDQWRLLGFGVNGPGCEAPARFLDYGMYYPWVKQSLARIGRPAITRLGPDHIIIRRSLTQFQRFGDCDGEETRSELFNDYSSIKPNPKMYHKFSTVTYNLTLLANVEYSCVKLRVKGRESSTGTPRLMLRRWCTNPFPACYDFSILQINFIIDIYFLDEVTYQVAAFGHEIKLIDTHQFKMYVNHMYFKEKITVPPVDMKNHMYFITQFWTVKPSLDVLFTKTGVKSVADAVLKKLQG